MSGSVELADLVVSYEELRDRNVVVSPEELCRDRPELLDALKRELRLLGVMDALLGSRPGDPVDTPADQPAFDSGPESQTVTAQSRFRLLRTHAAGGLGEVLVAYDETLQREVALKRLHAPRALAPHSRQRFLREAQITSRLEHPGIVSVHVVGQDADDRPFYAMRLVEGETLHQAIQRFHAGADGCLSVEHRLALRQLLSRVLAVCNTVAYAHSRGVLHRDIKPENIVLGPYGETWLVDWGLAKPWAATAPGGDRETEAALLDGGAAPGGTQEGMVLGTPAYMCPEQAAGRGDLLRPASDVYSLGATLYTLLTGQPPFQGRQVGEVLDKVKRGDCPPPRRLKSAMPAALEAVCLKAMAREPEARYSSAEALAADLERWMADEPVSAWPEPRTLWAWRWLGRHRMLVTASATAVVAALLIATGSAWLVLGAYRDESIARAQAEENYLKARGAFEQMTEAVEKWMANAPLMEPVRRQLLEGPIQFYESFLQEKGSDPAFRKEIAQAHGCLGDLYHMVGEHGKAEQAFQRALAFQEQLVNEGAGTPGYRHDLANTHNRLGLLFTEMGQYPQAEQAQSKAITLYEALAAEFPREAIYQGDVARACSDLAPVLMRAGRLAQAEEVLRKAIQLCEKPQPAFPERAFSRGILASSQSTLATLLKETNRPHEAEQFDRRARAEYEQLVKDHYQVTKYRVGLAATTLNLANHWRSIGRHTEADQEYRRALKLHQKLADDFPLVSEHRRNLAMNWNNLGNLLRDTGQPAPAAEVYREALKLCEKLAADSPRVPAYRQHLALVQTHLGALLQTMNQYPQAGEALRSAVKVYGQLVAEFPDRPDYSSELARSYINRGVFQAQTNRLPESEQDFREALRVQEVLADRFPSVANTPRCRRDRAEALNNLGECLRLRKRVQEAEGPSRQAVAGYKKLVDEFSDRLEYRQGLATSLHTLGDVLKDLAELLVTMKKHGEAAAAATESAQLLNSRAAYRHAAGLLARCVSLVEKDTQLAEDYAERAVNLLRQAIAKGHTDTGDLRKATAFESIRSRANFQDLLDELEAKNKK